MKGSYFAAALGAALGLGAAPAFAAVCAVSVSADIQPIFNTYCVACHQDAAPGEGLSLQSRTMLGNTVEIASTQVPDMVRIMPGDAEASYLYRKVTGTHIEAGGTGAQMPIGGELDAAALERIRSWIEDCGAAG